MGWFEELFGVNPQMSDQDIALDLLKDAKFEIHGLAMAISETNHPQLRQILKDQLITCIEDKFRLTDILVENGWYQPHLTPRGQVNRDLIMADEAQVTQ